MDLISTIAVVESRDSLTRAVQGARRDDPVRRPRPRTARRAR